MFDALQPILPDTATEVAGELHVGGVAATALADAHGTPLIVYDAAHVERAARAWVDALADWEPGSLVAYASKAFSSVGMLQLLNRLGLGVDVSSLGELAAATRAGVDPAKVVLHGNNKSALEIRTAVETGVGLIVVDAEQELVLVEEQARQHGTPQPVLIRVNPDIEVETHRYISTSHGGSKFGVPSGVAAELLARADRSEWLVAEGVHVHLGSQLLDTDPWRRVLEWLGDWAVDLRASHGIELRTLDVGGGLGIAYLETQAPPTPADIVHTITGVLRGRWQELGLALPRLVVEPGRSIVGQAALTLYRVGVTKDAGDDIRYVNVDGGMSDNPRPVLYQAQYRALLAERVNDAATGAWWVAGVHCESGDVLIEDADLPEPRPGELLAIPATGAYAASMASSYNMVLRPEVVLVRDGVARTLIRRDTFAELFTRDAFAPEYRA